MGVFTLLVRKGRRGIRRILTLSILIYLSYSTLSLLFNTQHSNYPRRYSDNPDGPVYLDGTNNRWIHIEGDDHITQRPLRRPRPRRQPNNQLYSTLDCQPNTRSCLITNLYVINKTFHVYVGDNPIYQHYAWEFTVLMTGLGFGSPQIEFVTGDGSIDLSNFRPPEKGAGSLPFDPEHEALILQQQQAQQQLQRQQIGLADSSGSIRAGINTTTTTTDSTIAININNINDNVKNKDTTNPPKYKLYIHRTAPPPHKTLQTNEIQNLKYFFEPVVFVSVLWENLFRTLYAGVASWFTMMEYKVFFPEHYRFILMDPSRPKKFLQVLQAATNYPLQWFDNLEDGIYKAAVIGVSRDINVAEIDLEKSFEYRFGVREVAFRLFCSRVKQMILSGSSSVMEQKEISSGANNIVLDPRYVIQDNPAQPPSTPQSITTKPRLTFILRDGDTRKITNVDQVISYLRTLPIDLQIHSFSNMNLRDQIHIIDNTDILISMHGAALTHLMFLRPNTYVIELFPFVFRKMIYQNLAAIMNVKYLMWQNTRREDTVFNWKYVEEHRFTPATKEEITSLPINWSNMDSKNYWRNQDTRVDTNELNAVMKTLLSDRDPVIRQEQKFMVYLPWEQFNNQIIGFKSACAVASLLNRTLVLPFFGYKQLGSLDALEMFRSFHYVWKPFERYFDTRKLLKNEMPCSTISYHNFWALNGKKSIGTLRYHSLGETVTSQDQLVEYYRDVLSLDIDRIVHDNVYYQLTEQEILDLHGKDDSRVLALGSMFWYYDFGIKQVYPLRFVYNYLSNPLYKRITNHLQYHPDIHQKAKFIISTTLPRPFIAIHLRRGDYKTKCEEYKTVDMGLYKSCYPSFDDVISKITTNFPVSRYPYVYVSTNTHYGSSGLSDIERLRSAGVWEKVLSQADITPVVTSKDGLGEAMDSIELTILDQLVAVEADGFVGNLHSSFSRFVIEGRVVRGKEYLVF